MSVIIHPSPLSSYFSNNSQETNGIGWGIALQLHSFGLCGSEAVVTIFRSYIYGCLIVHSLDMSCFAFLIQIILKQEGVNTGIVAL